MNRKIYASILVALICLAFGFLTGCSGSSAPVIAIMASSGSGQGQTIGEAFTDGLVAKVTSNGSAASGVIVTFTSPSSGASCTPSSTTATTDANGNASITCTANSTAGRYSVSASATGATTPATFNETNASPSVFVFYVSGLESIDDTCGYHKTCVRPPYYAIVGAVDFDLSGKVLGGEQDYNDGKNIASPAGGDTITADGSSLTVDQTTGTGTLILATSNGNAGLEGVETFAVQFINTNHALIAQFDGTATSSGSLDLQTNTPVSGNFAFTVYGVDLNYNAFGAGGVFTVTSGALTGNADVNDEAAVTLATAGNFTAAVNDADSYGRGTLGSATIGGKLFTLVYYIVGGEALRLIDMDTPGVFVGSAYGQGSVTSLDSTALGTADVFAIQGTPWGLLYAATGSFVPSGAAAGVASATFSGEGDLQEENGDLSSPTLFSGNYTIASNGYGRVSDLTDFINVTTLGLYVTDPALNLLDPNNTSGGGGALLLDLANPGGTGVVVPQASTTAATDLNHSYGFGAQDFTDTATLPPAGPGWEFDLVGQGTFATLAWTGTADISDPFAFFVPGTAGEYTAVPLAGTASGPDAAGRYEYSAATPFAVGPVGTNTTTTNFTVVMYEANPALLFSIERNGVAGCTGCPERITWLGTFQEQSASGTALSKGKPAAKAAVSKKR